MQKISQQKICDKLIFKAIRVPRHHHFLVTRMSHHFVIPPVEPRALPTFLAVSVNDNLAEDNGFRLLILPHQLRTPLVKQTVMRVVLYR